MDLENSIKEEVELNPKLLFGTGVSSSKDYDELYNLVRVCITNGIFAFDTAPSYGTESILGKALNKCMSEQLVHRESLFIQSKIDGWQMQEGKIEKYTRTVLEDMNLEYLDALLIHWPFPEYLEDTWNKLLHLKSIGLVKKIGICNLRERNINELLTNGIIPEILQIERNPLNTMEEEVILSRNLNIGVQAYSPLCKMDERIKESSLLLEIARKYNKNIGQIVLRWQIDTGVSPIFTSKKEHRIKEYAEVFDFSLNDDEINICSSLNQNYKLYLESFQCPGL